MARMERWRVQTHVSDLLKSLAGWSRQPAQWSRRMKNFCAPPAQSGIIDRGDLNLREGESNTGEDSAAIRPQDRLMIEKRDNVQSSS